MAIEVEITGTGGFAGHKSNITSYSYSEESTPIFPGDSSGGTGELSINAMESPDDTILLYGNGLEVSDSFAGRVTGFINSVSVSDSLASISGRARLGLLNTPATVTGGATTLGAFIEDLLAAGSIDTDIRIDPSIDDTPIIAPTVTGDLWVLLKDLCTAYQFEVAQIQNGVIIRPLRQREIDPLNLEAQSWSVREGQLAQRVEVAYFNYDTITDKMVYPLGGWNADVQVYQVDAGQTLVIDIPVNAYLTSVEQPSPQLSVDRDYSGPDSVYAIAGNDGLPVPVAQWTDGGGSVTVALKENGTVIEATLVGANIPNLAPFRLAVSSGPSDFYSALRIMGSGVTFERQTVTVGTGLTAVEAPTEVGITIENPFISTRNEAIAAGTRARVPYSLPRRTYSITARRVNRQAIDGGTVIYPSFQEYNATLIPGLTFGGWNAIYAGDTFQDFTDEQFALVADEFENQAFGNIGGSRVRYRDTYYRVRQATSTQDNVSLTAEADTLVEDFNQIWPFDSFAEFNAEFSGLRFGDFSLVPLRRQEPVYTRVWVALDEDGEPYYVPSAELAEVNVFLDDDGTPYYVSGDGSSGAIVYLDNDLTPFYLG